MNKILLTIKKIILLFTALKIHITAEMKDKLAIIGGFKTEHRGLIDVKVSICIFHKYRNKQIVSI